MSTTFEIGRWPAAVRRCLSHSRRGPDLHVLEHARGEAQADRRGRRSRRWRGRPPCRRRAARRRASVGSSASGGAGGGVHLARDAVDRQAVGPVGGDLELEHLVGDRQVLGQRRARPAASSGSTMIPVVVLADADLVLGQDHPARLHAAQLGLAELRAVGHRRRPAAPPPRSGRRPRWARRRRSCAARRSRRPPRRRVSRSASGCCSASSTLPTTKPSASPTPTRSIRSSSVPVMVQALGDLLGRQAGVAVGAQPAQRDPHARPNCSRKRTSFSNSMRRSGTPWTSIAIRSMPMPNAKPCTRSGS